MSWNSNPVALNTAGVNAIISSLPAATTDATTVIGDGFNPFTGISGLWEIARIGALVFATNNVGWTGKGSASGNIGIDLPTTASSAVPVIVTVMSFSGITATSSEATITATGGPNVIQLRENDTSAGGASVVLTDAEYATSGNVRIGVIYAESL